MNIIGGTQLCIGGQVRGASSVEGDLYPYVVGSVTKIEDGAIERVDEKNMTTKVLYTENEIGGNMLLWVFDSPVTGWAVAGLGDRYGGEGWGLTRFDLTAGTFKAVSSFQKSDYTWALDCTGDGLVLVGSKDEDNPGVWVYDSKNDHKPVFEKPINVGLLPARLIIVS